MRCSLQFSRYAPGLPYIGMIFLTEFLTHDNGFVGEGARSKFEAQDPPLAPLRSPSTSARQNPIPTIVLQGSSKLELPRSHQLGWMITTVA